MTSLATLLDSPFTSYIYSYPHKTSYRPFAPPLPLDALWAEEKKDALSLYVHVPFCEARCGYCNLFSTIRPPAELVEAYVATVERQARIVKQALGTCGFSRFAIGGGTPTWLPAPLLERVLDVAERTLGADLPAIPTSVEVSPATSDPERLGLLRRRGIRRISIGVQSFREDEVAAVARPQRVADADRAIAAIRAQGFPVLNVDLIYGLPGQTPESWEASLGHALQFAPEELYLYPLYVRPLTGLGRSERQWADVRLELYRQGRDYLLARGYRQVSMRMFRLERLGPEAGPVYRCQEDGMVGLGTGARSYTRDVHYATPYAIGRDGVLEVIRRWVGSIDGELATARHGIRLGGEDQRRRYAILSLLADGLEFADYRARFGSEALADMPELADLVTLGLGVSSDERLVLNATGVERSDAIGPWLCSARVRELMDTWERH